MSVFMNKLIAYIRKTRLGKIWFVKNTRSSGFSILEISIVLGIMAIASVTGITVLNGRIEQNAVDRIVADLTIVAEAAYECYIATAGCEDSGGWRISEAVKATEYLNKTNDDGEPVSFLPQKFSDNYEVEVKVDDKSELVIQAVNLPNDKSGERAKRIALRVAHTFGSLADEPPEGSKVVVVRLGIPGTESALSGLLTKIKTEDFEFEGGQYDIGNVNNIVTQRIRLGGSMGVELLSSDVKALKQLINLDCIDTTPQIIYKNRHGKFECRSRTLMSCPVPDSVKKYSGDIEMYIGEHRIDDNHVDRQACTARCPDDSMCTATTRLRRVSKPGKERIIGVRCDISGRTVKTDTKEQDCKIYCPVCS